MRTRVLIGLGLALLVVIAVVVFPWRSLDVGESSRPGDVVPGDVLPGDAAGSMRGADGIGDSYFPRAGNGGYDVSDYDIQLRYDPATDRLEGRTTITALATQNLSQFNLDLRLPATAVEVSGRPATISQGDGELVVTRDRA